MGVVVLRAPGGHKASNRSPEQPQKFGHGPSLLVNCYLEIKFNKKIRVNPTNLSIWSTVSYHDSPTSIAILNITCYLMFYR